MTLLALAKQVVSFLNIRGLPLLEHGRRVDVIIE